MVGLRSLRDLVPPYEKGRARRGQAIVEFAIVALVIYLLLGAILTFGQWFYRRRQSSRPRTWPHGKSATRRSWPRRN